MAEKSSDPKDCREQPAPDTEADLEEGYQAGEHKDPHRAAQATLDHTAGPEGADPVDNMQTESPEDGDDKRNMHDSGNAS